MPLTDLAIRNAKPAARTVKLSDGGGLQLWVEPRGAKLWRLAYRFDGQQKKLSIGTYPEIDLRTARERREDAKRLLRDGQDPSAVKRLAKLTGEANRRETFGAIAAELQVQKTKGGLSEATINKFTWHIKLAEPLLGKRPISEITAAEVLACLRKVEARGHHETANRLKSIIGAVFRFAVATQRAAGDPTQALRGALISPVVKSRAALTEPKKFGALLRAIEAYEGMPLTRHALRLMALLFPRPGELRLAEWREFDLDEALWIVPAGRMKMRRPHSIPLPRQALEILAEIRAISGGGALVFPSVRSAHRPMSENTLNTALRVMGFSADQATAHGFRASASTLLNESRQWSADAIERALAHEDEDKARKAYARGQYWDERVCMGKWWADHLDALRQGTKIHSPAKQ